MMGKKTRPDAATPERARAEKAAGNTSIPVCDYTPGTAHSQPSIADLLGHDRESARKGRELCAALHLDSRTLRQRIERERRAGELIISNNADGYWLARGPAEAQAFVRSMRHRAGEILRTARALEEAAHLD